MNDKIAEYIESLAQQLGVAVTHVYEVMTRQMVAEGITYGLLSLAVVVVIPIVVYKLARLTMEKYNEDMEFYVFMGWFIGGIGALILFAASLLSLPDYVMHVVNPEYYTVKEILDALK
ncbi:hypothetical protein [Brevibacillus reuszeri]|uniref:hypothetical protein n=1 Tax=Brevibacillus reuszeri TaxID=54915 RepID=UPI000CCC6E7C|nr:hypothetical protein [Brevibacillus reuszeri]